MLRSETSKEVFVITKVKTTVPWAYDTSDPIDEEIVGSFSKKQFQKTKSRIQDRKSN